MLQLANVKKTWYYLQKNGVEDTYYAVRERFYAKKSDLYPDRNYRYRDISKQERKRQQAAEFADEHIFSIVVPMYETDPQHAREMIDSVLAQTYPGWELILADASTSDVVERTVSAYTDARIHYHRLPENGGISENTDRALAHAVGEYTGLLDHDDLLTPDALYEMASAITEAQAEGKEVLFAYSDEDKCDENAQVYYEPNIKPEFNLDLLLSNNYICHFLVMKTERMKELGFRKEYDGAQDFDLVLRAAVLKGENEEILHVNKVLYHWRCHGASTAANPHSKMYAYEAGRRAVEDAVENLLRSQGASFKNGRVNGGVVWVEHTKHNGFYRVEYGCGGAKRIFDVRKDIGMVVGSIQKKGKITGGIKNSDGICPYAGLPSCFSGYLHRNAVAQDCECADLDNAVIRPELLRELEKEYKCKREFINDDDGICRFVRNKGYRILYDPFFERRGAQRVKTTVIIPNYNGKEYLRKCLRSLEGNDEIDFLTIVVDNGSTDGSVEMLKEEFPQVESIFLPENTGFAAAVNRGIERARTEYVLLLNNDTSLWPYFISSMEEPMDQDKKTFSASARMIMMNQKRMLDGAGDQYCALGWAHARGKGQDAFYTHGERTKIFSSCAGAAIYRMDVLKKIGLFDENHFAYLEDVDIGYRAKIYGYHNVYEPAAVCYHAGSASSGSRYNEFKISLSSRNSIYLILKNMPFLQILLNLPFLLIGFLTKIVFFAIKGYGHTYCKGLLEGFSLYFSKEGRKHKVPFLWRNLPHYVGIEVELLVNICKMVDDHLTEKELLGKMEKKM